MGFISWGSKCEHYPITGPSPTGQDVKTKIPVSGTYLCFLWVCGSSSTVGRRKRHSGWRSTLASRRRCWGWRRVGSPCTCCRCRRSAATIAARSGAACAAWGAARPPRGSRLGRVAGSPDQTRSGRCAIEWGRSRRPSTELVHWMLAGSWCWSRTSLTDCFLCCLSVTRHARGRLQWPVTCIWSARDGDALFKPMNEPPIR